MLIRHEISDVADENLQDPGNKVDCFDTGLRQLNASVAALSAAS